MKSKLISLAALAAVVLLLFNVSNGNIKIDALTGPSKHKHSHVKIILPEKDTYTTYLNTHTISNTRVVEAALRGEKKNLQGRNLVCTVPKDDDNAAKYARKLRQNAAGSGLKLEIREEDPLMAVSKAEDGRFQLLVVSSATAKQYQTDTLKKQKFIEVMTEKGTAA